MQNHQRAVLTALSPLILSSLAVAQGPVFQTPGMGGANYSTLEDSQTSRFSSLFNPAFSFVVDAIADHVDWSGRSQDGFNLELRTLELAAQAWIDPNAWAYFIAATDGEEFGVEEAAIHYVGFEGNQTLRAGRFFLDFGRQMQTHVHELRTVERPLVLRAYLGAEVAGDGVQWDDWRPIGDRTVLRWSLGVFASLLPEEEEYFEDPARDVEDRKEGGDLNYSARLTGFTELSDSSTFQAGGSARVVPNYGLEFEATGDRETDLSSLVWGLDATYGWVDETGQRTWTAGAELLVSTGDVGAENPAPGVVNVIDGSATGYFAFLDHGWNRFNSAGFQYSEAELPDAGSTRASEIELYYRHGLSEFHRLRFGVGFADMEAGEDSVRFVVQYTGVLGAHGHGVNW